MLRQGSDREAPLFLYRVRLFSLFGFAVSIDASWLLLAVLVSWSLAAGLFPYTAPGLPVATYWAMAVVTTIGLFASIVFHETAHAVVARRYGIPIRGITLFIFGGVAEMDAEPGSARGELLMAAAGPIASMFLGLVLGAAFEAWPHRPEIAEVLRYLAFINWTLALFNLVPAFPLDGGRMLRAALWMWRGDLARATRIAAGIGNMFGIFLIVYGIFLALTRDLIGGIWLFLIGMFLRAAASGSYSQTMASRLLAGLRVAQVMNPRVVAVPSGVSVGSFVEDYVYRHHHRWFPVTEDGRLVGSVSTREAAGVDRAQWESVPVSQIMRPLAPEELVGPDSDVLAALARMQRAGASRLIVTADGQLLGLLSSRDILRELALREELTRG